MRILARVACCAYLVFYVIIPMLKPPVEDETMSPEWRIGIAVVFIIAVAAIVGITAREVVINWKAGLFKADAYSDDPEIGGVADEAESAGVGDGDDEGDEGDEGDEEDEGDEGDEDEDYE